MTSPDLDNQKDVEFFAAGVNAYYASALERDKSILTLSTGGIGLLLTLLTTVGTKSIWVLVFSGIAVLYFLICVFSLLTIFQKNNEHIERILNGTGQVDDPELAKLDKDVRKSFAGGVMCAVVVGGLSAWNLYSDKLEEAREKREKDNAMTIKAEVTITGSNVATESYNGVLTLTKSFNGIASLRPQQTSTQTVPTQAAASQTSSNPGSSPGPQGK